MGKRGWLVAGSILGALLLVGGCGENEPSAPPPELGVMSHFWSFNLFRFGASAMEPVGAERRQVGGAVAETVDFGSLILRPPGTGPRAQGEVFSNETGQTYWVSTQAPNGNLVSGVPIGSSSELQQFQVYHKRDSNATLQLVISKAFLEGIDGNPGDPTTLECPWHLPGASFFVCQRVMSAWLDVEIEAFSTSDQKVILHTGGYAELRGWRGNWFADAFTTGLSNRRLWKFSDFIFDRDVDQFDGGHSILGLAAPLVVNVPLDSVAVGHDFYLNVEVSASALNHRQRETYLSAFFRDPAGSTGLDFAFTGLDPIATPAEKPSDLPLVGAGACTGGAGGGTLQFSAPAYATPELLGIGGTVVITRTGGSSGATSATLTTSDGSAAAGSDYTFVSTLVLFADGEDGSRAVRIPILNDNTEEPDKTVNLTLSDPKGCASLGQPSTATLTIMDDDRPIVLPPTFTVGGTVTGLAGAGLVLSNLGSTVTPAIGPFVFAAQYPDGIPFDVRVMTQPTSPDQVCTVANGSGTIVGADVTDVQVTCVTQQPNGALDPTYGVAGKVTTGLPRGASSIALQADGKTVVVGGLSMARYDTDGSLDASFGTGGLVTIAFNGGLNDEVQGLAIQPDGKIVVVGFARVGTQNDFAVARFTSSGVLDPAFGTGGKVTTDFNGQVDEAWAALIQPDGAIVVAGHAATNTALGPDNDFAVARYTGTGTLDASFGTGGKVMTNIGGRTDLAHAAALQSDGKIVVTGRVANGGGDNPDVGIVRYGADGTLDTGFGTQGKVQIDLTGGEWDEASDIVIQSDGKLLVAVQALVGSTFDFEVARFTPGGALDPGFGTQGVATAAIGAQHDFARAMALQSDGKIVVVGSAALTTTDLAVARFQSGGALDTGFGIGGKVTVDFFGASDGAEGVVVQTDGRIVVAGLAVNGSTPGLGMVRILP